MANTVEISDAYQSRGNEQNLIIVDWDAMSEGSYLFDAIPNVKELGEVFGEKLVNLAENESFPLENVHLIGHSLGGQLVGYIGRAVWKKSNAKLKIRRITGLDPAFPGFFPAILGVHLSRTDADFVDVIHTDAWFYGSPASKATVDFWPNNGKSLQPGCPKRNFEALTKTGKKYSLMCNLSTNTFLLYMYMLRFMQSSSILAILGRIC